MAIRHYLDLHSFRRGKALPAVAALAIALLAGFGVQSLLFGDDTEAAQIAPLPAPAPIDDTVVEPAPPVVEEPDYPSLLVAKREIESGAMLTSDLVEWREWQEPIDVDKVILQHNVRWQAILGSVTRQSYDPDTPVVWDGIITPGRPGFISAVLAPGMRAVTIEVDQATTSANLIFPGDRVDVILVSTQDAAQAASQAIVRDVRVLAVGSTIFSLGRYGPASSFQSGALDPVVRPEGENYTLELLPVDAERVALGITMGRLTLAMRSAVAIAPENQNSLRAVHEDEVIVEAAPPPAARPIRIIRGGAVEEVVVGDI